MTLFKGKLPLELVDHRGKKYKIKFPIQSGGKAGIGRNKTSTVQVMYENTMVVKQIRFTLADNESKMTAIKKGIAYVIGQRSAAEYFADSNAVNKSTNEGASVDGKVPG